MKIARKYIFLEILISSLFLSVNYYYLFMKAWMQRHKQYGGFLLFLVSCMGNLEIIIIIMSVCPSTHAGLW